MFHSSLTALFVTLVEHRLTSECYTEEKYGESSVFETAGSLVARKNG